MKCKICLEHAERFDSAMVLGKYLANFYRCQKCGFIQVDNPLWLIEAYIEPVNSSDVGMVDRTLRLSQLTNAVISVYFDRSGKFVDYGGGYGLFTRIMRDRGLDFFWYDKYCKNIFAPNYSVKDCSDVQFEMVTAFEVIEHLTNPLEEFSKMLTFSQNVLVTTELVPSVPPQINSWWYYGIDHGQHISFYTLNSLQAIAERFGLSLTTNGRNIHLFTKRKINPTCFKFIVFPAFTWIIKQMYRNCSLLEKDFQRNRMNTLRGKGN
jgi:hypothetical protein